MIYTPLTKTAMQIACEKHKGQSDRCGFPYILHPVHVAESMQDEITTAAAILHDVIEDTDTSAEELLERGIQKEVVDIVRILTKGEDEDYFCYVQRVCTNPNAILVKLSDLEHNMDLTRLNEVLPKDLKRMEKYKKAKEILLNYQKTGSKSGELDERTGSRTIY